MPSMPYSIPTSPPTLFPRVLKIFLASRSLTNWIAESIMKDALLYHLPQPAAL